MAINWDQKLTETLIEYCHRCNDFIVTNDKAELTLFMFDHYGKDGIRLCTARELD